MTYKLIYPESCVNRARIFLKKHPEIHKQYRKTLELLELNPYHPSLRLHGLQGRMSSLSSVSINISYRIVLEFMIEGDEILLVNVGKHDQIY
jgi:mRNA-degrading endonuclease YafQ of YafQ-DinJ toxin-antitoxin module